MVQFLFNISYVIFSLKMKDYFDYCRWYCSIYQWWKVNRNFSLWFILLKMLSLKHLIVMHQRCIISKLGVLLHFSFSVNDLNRLGSFDFKLKIKRHCRLFLLSPREYSITNQSHTQKVLNLHSFSYKNNFIRTKALILARQLWAS